MATATKAKRPVVKTTVDPIKTWPGIFVVFEKVKQIILPSIWTLVFAYVMYYAGALIITLVINQLFPHNNALNSLFSLVLLAGLVSILYGVLTNLYLNILRHKEAALEDALSSGWNSLINTFLLLISLGLIAFVSLVALIVPFFFIVPRLIMAPYLLIDKKLTVIEALTESWRLTNGHLTKIYGLIGLQILIELPLVVGVYLSALTGNALLQTILSVGGLGVTFYLILINTGVYYYMCEFMFERA